MAEAVGVLDYVGVALTRLFSKMQQFLLLYVESYLLSVGKYSCSQKVCAWFMKKINWII